MRRLLTTAVIVAVTVALVGFAMPADGKKPASGVVEVTMALSPGSSQGLTTECGPLLLVENRDGLGEGEQAPAIGVYMADVAWSRQYTSATQGEGLAGCHDSTHPESPLDWPSYLQISMDRNGAVTDIVWNFSHYVDEIVSVHPRTGRERVVGTIHENFRLSGHDLLWDDKTSTVRGDFHLSYYPSEDSTFQEFDGSPQWFEFTVEVNPVD